MPNQGLFSSFSHPKAKRELITYNGVANGFDKDFRLSSSDMGKNINFTSTNGYAVKLPDTKQLAKLEKSIIISNRGSLAINVMSNNGGLVTGIAPNSSTIFLCTDINANSWKTTSNRCPMGDVLSLGSLANESTIVKSDLGIQFANQTVCSLNATTVLITYGAYNGTASGIVAVYINGDTVVWGTPVTGYFGGLFKIDSSRALYRSGNEVRVISVSGQTTVSVGSAATTGLLATDGVVVLSPTVGIIFTKPTYLYDAWHTLYVVNISGTSVSIGSSVQVAGILKHIKHLDSIDSTRFIYTWSAGASGDNLQITMVSVVNGTITIGSNWSTTDCNGDPYPYINVIDANTAVVVYQGTSSKFSARVIKFSGTTISTVSSEYVIRNGYSWNAITVTKTPLGGVLFIVRDYYTVYCYLGFINPSGQLTIGLENTFFGTDALMPNTIDSTGNGDFKQFIGAAINEATVKLRFYSAKVI